MTASNSSPPPDEYYVYCVLRIARGFGENDETEIDAAIVEVAKENALTPLAVRQVVDPFVEEFRRCNDRYCAIMRLERHLSLIHISEPTRPY